MKKINPQTDITRQYDSLSPQDSTLLRVLNATKSTGASQKPIRYICWFHDGIVFMG